MTPEELETIKIALDNGLEINDEAIRLLISHIKELESRIPRWIPVGERLPERWAIVLVYRKEDGIPSIAWNKDGQWFDEADVIIDITHWQPLPKGPEE